MSNNTHTISTLHQLLNYNVGRLATAEVQLKERLADWIEIAGSFRLKVILQRYHDLVGGHVRKMESLFSEQAFDSFSESELIIGAFIKACDGNMEQCSLPAVRDAALVAILRPLNQFKISAYNSTSAFASELGMKNFAIILDELKENEEEIDELLSELAKRETNPLARGALELTFAGAQTEEAGCRL